MRVLPVSVCRRKKKAGSMGNSVLKVLEIWNPSQLKIKF